MSGATLPTGRLAARRSYHRVTAWLLWLFILGNLAGTIELWVAAGGFWATRSLGDALNTVGRLTGMIGAYLALVQVVLLARMPWFERLIGFDRLTVWHRWNGKATLYLVVGHVIFTTWGYAENDQLSIWGEIKSLLGTTYPGMWTATVGTVLFIVVALSSYRIARKRLRYEIWYAIHFTAYASIALAWFHQIPTGSDLAALPTAEWYWRSLYIATLALLVVFRVLVPLGRTLYHGMRVTAVTTEAPGVVSLTIGGRRLDLLHAQAGQFFLWRFLTRGHWAEAHPFSLSTAPDGKSLRITVKGLGNFTRDLDQRIPVGTRVVAEGPFGAFTSAIRRHPNVVLIAGGIGITPVRSLLEEIGSGVTVLYRALRDEDVVFRAELDRIAAANGATVHYLVGDHNDPAYAHLLSADNLRELIPHIDASDIYVCGPPGMTDATAATLRSIGTPRRNLHIERFAL